ncbi:MAG TPA: phosphotransferase [Rhodanobacteraceae bacterium]
MPASLTDRAQERLAWARQALADPALTLAPASADASFRSYWRAEHAHHSFVIMDAPPPAEDIRPWLAIGARLAAAGIHVPAVFTSDVERGFALIEDFGNRLYLPALNDASVDGLYAQALDALLAMQKNVSSTGLDAYDAAFLRREVELLIPWFLERHLGHVVGDDEQAMLDAAFTTLVDNATNQPQCFVHRDFHSRNLMLTDGANPGVIDFQGALRGPITYDLASLLRDCYIVWDDARVDAWAQGHRQKLLDAGLIGSDIDPTTFRRWFDLTGLQRHIKVLGLFCRLAYRDGKLTYLADLPRVLDYVVRIAGRHAELAPLANLLRDVTAGIDLTCPRHQEPASCAR